MADVPDELAQVAEQVAADVYKGWRTTANRDAHVGQAIRAAAHQAVSAALAGRAVVDLPEPDGVDENGDTWWEYPGGKAWSRVPLAHGRFDEKTANRFRRMAAALLAATEHNERLHTDRPAAGSGAGERL